jgi:DNA-binding MarR family transcriptional regulator
MPSTSAVSTTSTVAALAERLVVTCARFTRSISRLSPHESPTAVWRTLAVLDEHGAVRVSDLAAYNQCSQPTATGMVQRLEADGAVLRVRDPDDGRATLVSLSAAGRERLARLRADVAEVLAPKLTELSPDRIAELEGALQTISALMDHPDQNQQQPYQPAQRGTPA